MKGDFMIDWWLGDDFIDFEGVQGDLMMVYTG